MEYRFMKSRIRLSGIAQLVLSCFLLMSFVTLQAQTQATMVSPSPGSVLPGTTTTFTRTTNAGIAQAWIWVGTTAGGSQLGSYGGAGVTSATPTNLPTNRSTVYVRLWSLLNGAWLFNDYTYTAATLQPAVMTSPTSGSVLPGASTTFTWTASGIAQAWMWVGTTAGGSQLGSYGGAGATTATPTNLPTNDAPSMYASGHSLTALGCSTITPTRLPPSNRL
jgi:hypothetical protein